jgi:ABC-type transporter Mla subunit MlaD
MGTRRKETPFFGNPVLVGAMTVLVLVLGVTLAYEANNGLPFVPTYSLNVLVSDANEVGHGVDVRMGGSYVGFVQAADAVRGPGGLPAALLKLKLNKSIEPLPIDSTFAIRLKAAIGLKYLAITPGRSRTTFEDGATVPIEQSSAAVDLDQVLSMFDPPTRQGVQQATAGFGYGLAGRGADLNDAIGVLQPLLADLEPVMRNLSNPRTQLGPFFTGLERFTGALAPVATVQASLFSNLDATFRALASVATPFLDKTIAQTPGTLDTVTADGPRLQPFLTDSAALFSALTPGANALARTAPELADALQAGTRNLPSTASLDPRVVSLADKLDSWGQLPPVQQGLDRVTLTAQSAKGPLAFLTPAQATCNYATLLLRNVASLLSENSATGTTLRFVLVAAQQTDGGEVSPSSKPYTGAAGAGFGPLHVNPYPNTDAPGQTPECEAGNEPFLQGPRIGNVPGNVGLTTVATKR